MSAPPCKTITGARAALPGLLRSFRESGAGADPVLVGRRALPEAAILPFDLYVQLLPAIDEIRMEDMVRERLATQTSRPMSELLEETGIDFDLG